MKKIKLNLGSGNDYKDGWVNVDADEDVEKDVYVDLSKKFPFKENYADEILASDILEHFTKEDGEKFLDECWRVMKVNGKITIRTHNIYKIFGQFKNDPYVLVHFLYGDTSETGILGSHKYAYTSKYLIYTLSRIGFNVLSMKEEETNFVIEAIKIIKITNNLRISVVMQSPDFGGAEEFMLNLTKNFRANKHRLFIATNEGKFFNYCKKESFILNKIPFFFDITGNYKGLFKSIIILPYVLIFYIKLLYFYKRKKIDIILMSGFNEKSVVSILSLFFKIPVIWIEYGPLATILSRNFYIPKILYRLLKRIPKQIIIPSKYSTKDIIRETRISLSKIKLIPCGVQVNLNFKKNENKTKKLVIGNISRATREKGQEYLLNAIPKVIKINPKVKFILVGEGPDLKLFKEKAKELNIEKCITFTGFVKDINSYYRKMDIFIFPSTWELEGFGLVAAEAMSRKIPVIGNNHGPIKEVLSGGAGFLVDVKDPDKLSFAINELIKNNKLRNEIAEAGFKKASEKYDIKKIAKTYEKILYNAVYFEK